MTSLDRLVVVLEEPQELVNIAMVVRAMKNMGFGRLRLVRPVEFDPYRIEGIAHDTADLVARVEVYETLAAAIGTAVRVVGSSARRRSSKQLWKAPQTAVSAILQTVEHGDVALLFGPEHRGLSNDQLDRCDEVICIPTNPDYTSLNLAHAVLLVCYELRRAAVDSKPAEQRDLRHKLRHRQPPATSAQREEMLDAWLKSLRAVRFLGPEDEIFKMRSLRSIFRRAELDSREVRFLQAVAYEFLHYERRVRARVADQLARSG